MMMTALHKAQLTADGKAEIEKELKELTEMKLPEVIKRVETARSYGDLSENAEYHSAKEDQELIETRIADLQSVLLNSTVVKQSKKTNVIGIGCNVTVNVKSAKSKKKMVLHIVGEFEADPKSGKISSVSPIGEALMGKKKGDKVEVETPAGVVTYEVVDVK